MRICNVKERGEEERKRDNLDESHAISLKSKMPFSLSQKLSNMATLFQKIPPSKRTTNDHNTE